MRFLESGQYWKVHANYFEKYPNEQRAHPKWRTITGYRHMKYALKFGMGSLWEIDELRRLLSKRREDMNLEYYDDNFDFPFQFVFLTSKAINMLILEYYKDKRNDRRRVVRNAKLNEPPTHTRGFFDFVRSGGLINA